MGRFYSNGAARRVPPRLLQNSLVPKVTAATPAQKRNSKFFWLFENQHADKNIAQYLLTLLIYLR